MTAPARDAAGARRAGPWPQRPVPWMKEAHKALPTRTSASHPITVSWLDVERGESASGCLGLCYCPGKNVVREGVRWSRDLQADLQRLLTVHRIQCVVCLLSDAELRALGVGRDYAAHVRAAGLELIQLPIIEMFAPEDMSDAVGVIEEVCARLERGHRCVLHCRGGVGRAGMLGACLLMRMGICGSVKEAIQLVRRRRCKRAVESSSQERFISEYARLSSLSVEGTARKRPGQESAGPGGRDAERMAGPDQVACDAQTEDLRKGTKGSGLS